jgi:predicted CopG family antitoxin
MGSKNISLREDAYRRLADAKADGESFSDAIDRLLSRRDGDHPLYDLVGLGDDEEAAEIRKRAGSFRDGVEERMERRS